MNRSLVIASAVVFASIGLAACGGGSDKGSDSTPTNTASANTDAKTVVKVDGKDLTGVDLSNVGCAKQGDRFAIGAGGASGGVGATLKDGNPPTVETVGITVDGTALAVGPGVGKATVKVDGDRYTITGTASGASISNPMAGMVSKDFEIVVTCK
ncbi:lipoprotein LpqH [Tsukamurella ocularis]|uniref:lipoprotein LpqH n=1 Tax=Tsukamurella ocularis TaxID=1970234 RepID=UPI00216822BC|nr:lipoprotein LpqH [Tsukamurella ocularis]MCS3780582.1 lipoprotein LpqH [Tsukamurella ocularis]MCS3785863.1 lipoprotein LpqH [Tsukamurella ocularis]MCS3849227.1 lipoprotein LpqH [Tsukamurella ocularis]